MPRQGQELARAVPAPGAAAVPRGMPRHKTFRVVEVEVAGVRHRGHMLNLSVGGACLHARCTVKVWNEVAMVIDARVLAGRVSWVAAERFGIRFATPLTAAEVDALLG